MKNVKDINISIKEGFKMSYEEFKKIHQKHFKVFKEKDREPKMKAKYIQLFPESSEAKAESKKEDTENPEVKDKTENEPKGSIKPNKPDKS